MLKNHARNIINLGHLAPASKAAELHDITNISLENARLSHLAKLHGESTSCLLASALAAAACYTWAPQWVPPVFIILGFVALFFVIRLIRITRSDEWRALAIFAENSGIMDPEGYPAPDHTPIPAALKRAGIGIVVRKGGNTATTGETKVTA